MEIQDAKQARPHCELIAELLDSRQPKTEREHAAVREIERLRHDIERHIAIASEHATECERLRAELAACRAAAVYLFNCGYMRGHHDTVEACFVDIHDSDMRTYQSDVVAEVIDEALTARKGEGE